MSARILAYHRLSDSPADGFEAWSIRPVVFRRQMLLLKRLGYRGVPVRVLMDMLGRGLSADKLVGVSFDDGYRDTVTVALPILSQLGFAATVYVVPEIVGNEADRDVPGADVPFASWQELAALVDAGWEIGLHSLTHPSRFDLLQGAELEAEISGGLNVVRDRLEVAVDTFAYPHGLYSDASAAALKCAGFQWAVTTSPGTVGPGSSSFELPRYELKRRDTLIEFLMLMLTGVLPRRRRTFARVFSER